MRKELTPARDNEGQALDWGALVFRLSPLHPSKLHVIEALRWIERPMSPAELENVLEDRISLPTLSYHVRSLAELGILELLEKERVGSVWKRTYYFSKALTAATR